MVRSTDWAAWTSAGSNARYDDSGMVRSELAEVGGLAADGAIGGEDALLDLHRGFRELLLAVPLQQRPALVGGDRLVELDLAALELLDDRLQLLQRVLERQRGNVLRPYVFFRQFGPTGGLSAARGSYCQRAALAIY